MRDLILSLLFIVGMVFVVCMINLLGLASAFHVELFSERGRPAFDLLQS